MYILSIGNVRRSKIWFKTMIFILFFLIFLFNRFAQSAGPCVCLYTLLGPLLVPFWGTFGALGAHFWHFWDQFWTFFGLWVALGAHFQGSKTPCTAKSVPRATQETPPPKFPTTFGHILELFFRIFVIVCSFFHLFFRYPFSTPFLEAPSLKKVTFCEVWNLSCWWHTILSLFPFFSKSL